MFNLVQSGRGLPARHCDALPDKPRVSCLPNPYHHRVWTREMLHTDLAETGFSHPAFAIGTGVVESGGRFDQHVETHHKSEGVAGTVVVN